MAAMEALRAAHESPPPPSETEKTTYSVDADNDTTYTEHATNASGSAAAAPKSILKKKGKPKLTNKEKKDRAVAIERIVNALPLEFRGNDPNLRRHIETVVEGFFDREGRGVSSE